MYDTIFMDKLFFTMEWSYISTMHIVGSVAPAVTEDNIVYIGRPLCAKRISLRPNLHNPVKDYEQVEKYLDNPKFEFLDSGDTIAQAICCTECMKMASLKLMVEKSVQPI